MKIPWRFLAPALLFAALAAVLAIGLRMDPNRLPSALIGKPAPQFSLESLGDPGWKVGTADLARQAWVLNVWGTWCPPCRVMSPILAELAADRPDVRFVKVDVDENTETAVRCQIAGTGGCCTDPSARS